MEPEEIKALRDELGCTARELAGALGIEQKTVLAWEDGELFPTKRFVKQMEILRAQGPDAIPRKPRRKRKSKTGVALLADPKLWEIVRKLLGHPELFAQVSKLADRYADPGDEDGRAR